MRKIKPFNLNKKTQLSEEEVLEKFYEYNKYFKEKDSWSSTPMWRAGYICALIDAGLITEDVFQHIGIENFDNLIISPPV